MYVVTPTFIEVFHSQGQVQVSQKVQKSSKTTEISTTNIHLMAAIFLPWIWIQEGQINMD